MNDIKDSAAACRALQEYLDQCIALVPQMGIRVQSLDDSGLTLFAPLDPNKNHIGTAFGGSLSGLATLSCWGLLWILLRDEEDQQIVIQDNSMRYMKPVRADFMAKCPMPGERELKRFQLAFSKHGKARLPLHAEVFSRGEQVGEFSGNFVAMRDHG